MITYTEADVEQLAEVLNAARDAGVHHGNYTLARWVLDRWPVEGSTPIASPARGFVDRYAQRLAEEQAAAPAGEVVSVPPPGEADVYLCPTCEAVITFTTGEAPRCPNCPPSVDEPAPVPPPVDALLKLVDEFGEDMADSGMADGTGARETGTQCMLDAQQARDKIVTALSGLWTAGVEEGRRQQDGGGTDREACEDHDRLQADLAALGEHVMPLKPRTHHALATLIAQVRAWQSADQKGYEPGDLAEAAEVLLGTLLLDGGAAERLSAANVWERGVAEGRRAAEAEFDNRDTYELASLVHRYLHVEAPDNSDPVQVAIEVLEEAIQDHGTVVTLETRGVAEGRRQATEKRVRQALNFEAVKAGEEQGVCSHCGVKIWLDGSGRWRPAMACRSARTARETWLSRRWTMAEPWYLPSTRETVTWGDALRRGRWYLVTVNITWRGARRRARARRFHWATTTSSPYLSSMRSSYRSRMIARRRRG